MPFFSYAQNCEDVILWRALKGVGGGFYVDVGAAHPDEDSVTRAFYDRGWRGINIEPVPAMARRIAAARPRDVTLPLAAGAAAGTATLHVVEDTGLSTTDPALAAELAGCGRASRPLAVPVRTLTAILEEHAPGDIHFLKIDVEGAERAVIEGWDRHAFRPRIVLVEATRPLSTEPSHRAWEELLLEDGYRFALFDGLNRFYVAEEWHAALAPSLAAPANVLDGFVRVADALWARQAAEAEAQVEQALARAGTAEESAHAAYSRAFEQARDLGAQRHAWEQRQAAAGGAVPDRLAETRALEHELDAARRMLDAMVRSTSWRVTQPLRFVSSLVRMRQPAQAPLVADAPAPVLPIPVLPIPVLPIPEPPAAPVAAPLPEALPPPSTPPVPLRAVHQFHSGSATGDAVTNSMLLIRRQLRALGYRSDIFVQHRDPALADELRLLADLPPRADHVLIVHHSMGYDLLGQVLAHPAPKVLYYHNITPAAFLPPVASLLHYAQLGREQLGTLRTGVAAALAASEYNAIELRRAGFDPVQACTLLFDVDALRTRAAARRPRTPGRPFTVLFVGRVIESKAQADLVDAFACFRTAFGQPARLVLVGRTDSPGNYLQEVDARMRLHGLEAELVLTGPVSDAELHAQYEDAGLYVSLSHHEGFGVPLMEAAAYGIPVLAWPCGAVPYTAGTPSSLLHSREPEVVAGRMLALATDAALRREVVAAQDAALDRFALPRQWPALQEALCRAGAAPPPDPAARPALAAQLRFTVTGHVNGSYSLAAINRDVAEAVEAELPGRVRLVPVEGGRPTSPSRLPAPVRPLAERPPFATGPEVVISQHYPIHVPDSRGDLALALVFWEESLLPREMIAALQQGFDGVLAPSAFVAKALIDSGLSLPVRVIGQAPDLSAFRGLARRPAPGPARPFTFLHVSSCFPRKGVDVLLAAYARAFRRGDPVRLVVKGFPNPHNTVPEQVAALRRADPGAPEVEVIHEDLDAPAMLDLFRQADALVLPSRGEGLNLPAAEAMAAGVPVIVTGLGGHMDFCGTDTARLLAYRLAPSGSHLASAGSLWAEPDLDDLVAALREAESARRDPERADALARQSSRARAAAASRLGRRAMVRRLQEAALDLLLRPPPAPARVAWVTSWAVRCGVAEYARHLITAMPPLPGQLEHVVLGDYRTAADPRGAPPAFPAWLQGHASSLGALAGAVAAHDPRIVVVQHQPGLMPLDMLAEWLAHPVLHGRVTVVTLHNTQDITGLDPDARGRLATALRGAARVMVHSVPDLHRLQDLGVSGNTTLMAHGAGVPLPPTAPAPLGRDALVGCYGFFLPGKGIGELIQALALLRRIRPGARLRLVNADYGIAQSAAEIERCRALAEEAGLGHAVEWETRFLPEEESLALLAGCDVIVLPTQESKEASSASVRTALAAGPAVMVTPLPVFANVGAAAVRAKGTTPAALAASLDALLGDPGARAEVQRAAQAWLDEHAWSRVAQRFQAMLLGLLNLN